MKDQFRPDEAGKIFDEKCEAEIMKILHEESEKDRSLCIGDVDVSVRQLRGLESDRRVLELELGPPARRAAAVES